MSYELFLLRRAQKKLERLEPSAYERVREAISKLAENPRPRGAKKVTGREGWRLRAGDFRVVYEIDDDRRTLTVLHVGHRRDVYR